MSTFRGECKRAAWQTWYVYPEASEVLAKLSTSMYPPVIGDEEKKVLERFAIIMYDRSSSATDIDSVRLYMFARKQKSYDTIPPTSAALDYHTKRAAYQAGSTWGQAITCQIEILSPSIWDWKPQDNSLPIVWTSLSPVCCRELQAANKMWMQEFM